jgi:hypothetical protein
MVATLPVAGQRAATCVILGPLPVVALLALVRPWDGVRGI